tara:strand:+ start:2771 stop:3682 length:912 start_codon:yes stop_codon:yes gene_type:complete
MTTNKHIINYETDSKFRTLIETILHDYGKLNKTIIKKILESDYDDKTGLQLYGQGFTHKSIDEENNYEYYEWIGDSTANNCICWYLTKRFPQLKRPKAVKILARLKANLGSKHTFEKLSESLGFWDFISSGMDELKKNGEIIEYEVRQRKKKDLLEDTLESFIGVTQTLIDNIIKEGVGYKICYNIIKNLYDKMDISLKYEDLWDPITRLKEIFDKYCDKGLGDKFTKKNIEATEIENEDDEYSIWEVTIVYKNENGKKIILGKGNHSKKKDAEQIAAKESIRILNEMGYNKEEDPIYKEINK